jgi:hypothetical protein
MQRVRRGHDALAEIIGLRVQMFLSKHPSRPVDTNEKRDMLDLHAPLSSMIDAIQQSNSARCKTIPKPLFVQE